MSDTIYRELSFESVKVVDEATRSIEVIASTAALDSHGEIVEQDWDLKRYLKNPVVLWNHNRDVRSPADALPIGRADNVRVEAKKLKEIISFASKDANPLAEQCWLLAKEGILKGVSVGFRPGEVTRQISDGREVYVLSKCELRETSMVPIGSNPEAVAKGIEEEHRTMAIFVAAKGAKATGEKHMKTIEELTSDLATANANLGVANKSLNDEREKAGKLERDLAAEKTLSAKLEADLKAERERSSVANAAVAKAELDKRANVKFLPAEREELDALVKDVGIERVCKLVDARPDIKLLDGVVVEGKSVGDQTPKEKSLALGASAQIASEAAEKAGV
jgi:HK97 family phage prohead protease